MDRDGELDLDLPQHIDLDLHPPDVDAGDGSGLDGPPDEGTGGGRGGRGGPGEPFFQSRWSAVLPAALILLFGAQSLLVLWLSRSGMGSEAATWALAALFIGTFTAVFIFGSRYIGRHRTR